MTELPGLPPFGAEPAFAADEDTYARLSGRAAARRRRRLAATSAAAAVAVAFAWAGGPAANGRSGLSPTDAPPSAPAPSSTGEPEPRPTGAPDPAASPTPGGPGRSAEPTPEPTAHPTAKPTPTVGPGCARHHDGWIDCHAPGTSKPRPEWHESSTMSDAGLAGCAQDERETAEGWCFRFLGPESTTSGVETDFSAELCRVSEHRGSDLSYAEFGKDRELAILLSSGDRDGDGETDHLASSFHGLRPASHRRYIPTGRCLRWSVTWNGVADDGRALPPGEYSLRVMLLGNTPRRPLPGEADQSTTTTHAEFREGYRVG